MLKRFFVVAAGAAFLLGAMALNSPSFHECMGTHDQKGARNQLKEGLPVFVVTSVEAVFCLGPFFEHNRDAFAAFSTVLIAAFTGTLWWSTEKLWRAGEGQQRIFRRQAFAAVQSARAARRSAKVAEEALAKIERPYVFVFGVTKIEYNRDIVGGYTPHIVITIANHGRTPAIIKNVCAAMSVTDRGEPDASPPRIDDDHELLLMGALAPGEIRNTQRFFAPEGIKFEHARERCVPELTGGEDFFFVVMVEYDGAFTSRHRTGACWRYHELTGGLVPAGGDKYNYIK